MLRAPTKKFGTLINMKLRVLFTFLCSAAILFGTANDVVVKKRTAAGNLIDYTIAVGNEGDTLKLTGGNPTWSASTGGSTLNGISAATANQSGISNGNFNVRWNWQKTTNSETAFEFGESAASTGGTSTSGVPNQVIGKFSTLAASTASPLSVWSRANHVFSVSPSTVQILGGVGSSSAPLYSFAGSTNSGLYYSSGDGFSLAASGVRIMAFGSSSFNNPAIAGGFLIRSGSGTPSAAEPTYSFTADSDTGLWRPAANTIGVSANASEVTRYTTGLQQSSYAAADTLGFANNFRKARGTVETPTAITTGDDLLALAAFGYVGSTGTYVEAANITFDSTGTIADTTTGVGGIIRLNTRAVGGALTEAVRVQGGTAPQLIAADGSSSAPTYSFNGSTNTGFFASGSYLGVTNNGSYRSVFSADTGYGFFGVTSNSSGFFLNTNSPNAVLSSNSDITSTSPFRSVFSNASNPTVPTFSMLRSRGTLASPTVVTTGDDIGRVGGYAYVGATGAFVEAANIAFDSTGTIADNSTGVGGIIRINARVVGSAIAEVANFSGTSFTQAAGQTYSVSSGTNQRAGNATLVGGTVTVNNTTVTANTIVMLTRKTAGGTLGNLTYTTSAATSFTINSDSGTDTSTVSYFLIEVP